MFGFKPREKNNRPQGGAGGTGLGLHPDHRQAQALNQAPDSIPGMFKPGEFVLPPDTVHAMGGKEALSQVVQATHTPVFADAVVPRGFKPEAFFANGGAPEDQTRKNSFGDAAAASLDSRVNQIPAGGPKAPAPDGRSDTELSRNVNNSLNAMAGMGVVSSVPLRQPPTSTALATIPPAAGFTPGALAKIGELKAAAAPQAAQAARGLPGTNAALQQGAQANAYAAAGRALGGASAGATALDNNRPADPMAPPKANSFGDAAAVTRGASAALPSAGALSMGAAPQAAPQASPQVTTPEARKAVGLFPYSSPDAGANIYAGFGLGKSGEQQDAPNDSRRIDSLVSQIPGNGGAPAPAADGSQGGWRDTELGRNANNAMMALPGIGGLGRIAATGGAISTGLNAASTGINAASRMTALGAGVTARGPASAAASATAPNPYANVTAEQGKAMAEINAKANANAPPASKPETAQQPVAGDITRIDRPGHSPLFTDNKDPDMARFLARPAGGPTKEVSDIMQRMSDKSQNEAFGRFQKEANAAQYAREVQQAQTTNAAAGQHARTVQNRMDQEKNLRKLDIKASGAGSLIERMAAQKAYNEALAQDAGFRAGADAGSVARTQNEGATARERMQQAGATERAGFGFKTEQQRAAIEGRRADSEIAALGFKTREAQQYEQLRNQIAQEQDPAKRQSAVQRMRDLSGTQQADPYLVVPGGQQVDEMGKPYNMPSSVFNRQSGQFVQQPAQKSAALPPGMVKQVGTSGGRPVYEDASGKRFSGG